MIARTVSRRLRPMEPGEKPLPFQIFQQGHIEKFRGFSSLKLRITVAEILYVVLNRFLTRVRFWRNESLQIVFLHRFQDFRICNLHVLPINPEGQLSIIPADPDSFAEAHEKLLHLLGTVLQKLAARSDIAPRSENSLFQEICEHGNLL